MALLETLLAFALTMLALATIVTLAIEMLARLTRRRGRVFGHMIGMVFEKEIWPEVEKRYVTVARRKQELKAFQTAIMESPLDPSRVPGGRNRILMLLNGLFGADRSEGLTREEFVRRLARSDVGKRLQAQANERVDEVVDRICARYDELSDASAEYFKSSSSVISLALGVLLAFGMNIDGYRIIQFYLTNPEAVERITDNADAIIRQHEEAQTRLNAALRELEEPVARAGADATAAANSAVQEAKAMLAQVQERHEEASRILDGLGDLGAPLGWTNYPACSLEAPDEKCASADGFWPWVAWFLSTLITGFLIGLGGPFWYDAVKGLMRATQVFRGRTAPGDAKAGETPQEEPPKPKGVFERHVDASPPPKRRLLGSDGRPYPAEETP